jgi:hypothetical protein
MRRHDAMEFLEGLAEDDDGPDESVDDRPYDGFRTFSSGGCEPFLCYVEYHLKGDAPDEWYDLFDDPPLEMRDRIVEFLNKEFVQK